VHAGAARLLGAARLELPRAVSNVGILKPYCPGALHDVIHGGAKPVLMPVGSSTVTREAEAILQQIELDVSIDDFATHRDRLTR
jgi:hypothetical protein